jgi:hypothetical protein
VLLHAGRLHCGLGCAAQVINGLSEGVTAERLWLLQDASTALRHLCWEALHTGPWHAVPSAWRDMHALSCLLSASMLLVQPPHHQQSCRHVQLPDPHYGDSKGESRLSMCDLGVGMEHRLQDTSGKHGVPAGTSGGGPLECLNRAAALAETKLQQPLQCTSSDALQLEADGASTWSRRRITALNSLDVTIFAPSVNSDAVLPRQPCPAAGFPTTASLHPLQLHVSTAHFHGSGLQLGQTHHALTDSDQTKTLHAEDTLASLKHCSDTCAIAPLTKQSNCRVFPAMKRSRQATEVRAQTERQPSWLASSQKIKKNCEYEESRESMGCRPVPQTDESSRSVTHSGRATEKAIVAPSQGPHPEDKVRRSVTLPIAKAMRYIDIALLMGSPRLDRHLHDAMAALASDLTRNHTMLASHPVPACMAAPSEPTLVASGSLPGAGAAVVASALKAGSKGVSPAASSPGNRDATQAMYTSSHRGVSAAAVSPSKRTVQSSAEGNIRCSSSSMCEIEGAEGSAAFHNPRLEELRPQAAPLLQTFEREFLSPGRPALLLGVIEAWPALSRSVLCLCEAGFYFPLHHEPGIFVHASDVSVAIQICACH